jgi:hypothetical protein
MQTVSQYKTKFIWALFLFFSVFGGTHRSEHAFLHSKVQIVANPQPFVWVSDISDDDAGASSYVFEEDTIDEDSDADPCTNQKFHSLDLLKSARVNTRYFGFFKSAYSLPLYILYCNWKYHLG